MVAAIVLFSGLFVRPALAQHPGELRVRVVDAVVARPVVGARVAVPEIGLEARTDGDGRVHLRGLPPGETELLVERLGYRSTRVRVPVRNGAVERVDLRLVPEAVLADELRVEAEAPAGLVLDAEAVRRSGARTTGELLELVPGVTIVRRGAGGAEEVRLRGGAGDQVLVLVDGVPLNDPITGSADLSMVPSGRVERVEVVPGAATARYGSRALAGVVLIRTRTDGAPVEAAARAGSLGQRGIRFEGGGRRAGVEIRGGAALDRLDGGFTFEREPSLGGGRVERRNADASERSAHFRLGDPEGVWTAQVRAEASERGVPGKSFAPSEHARQDRRALTATAGWSRPTDAGAWSWTMHHVRRAVGFRDPEPPLGPAFDDRSRFEETGATLRFERAESTRGVQLGASVEASRQRLWGDGLSTSARGAVVDGTAAAHGEVPLGWPLGEVVLAAALRGHRDGRTGDWLGAHEVAARARFGGGAGAAGRLHLSHRSSFSPPSAGDLHFREGVGIAPNPDLRPERVPSEAELGGSLSLPWGPIALELSGEIFAGDLRDMIVWTPDFRFTWSPRNVDVRRRGGEVRGRLRHPGWGIEGSAHLSRVRTEYTGAGGTPGVQVVYRPRTTAGLRLGWSRGNRHAALDVRHVGARFPVRAAANRLPPFWTVDLTAGAGFAVGAWSIDPLVRVDRLFDERAPFIHAIPEPGRTVRIELVVRPLR